MHWDHNLNSLQDLCPTKRWFLSTSIRVRNRGQQNYVGKTCIYLCEDDRMPAATRVLSLVPAPAVWSFSSSERVATTLAQQRRGGGKVQDNADKQ